MKEYLFKSTKFSRYSHTMRGDPRARMTKFISRVFEVIVKNIFNHHACQPYVYFSYCGSCLTNRRGKHKEGLGR